MKTKFIYVIMAVLLMGSQMTLSAQNTDNKQKKQRPTPEQMVQMQTKQISFRKEEPDHLLRSAHFPMEYFLSASNSERPIHSGS